MRLLKECFRVLKPGGFFSVCVPNAGLYLNAYSHPESFDASFILYQPAIISEQKMDIINYIAYMDGEHRYMFDQDNLVQVLSQAGFVNVCPRNFDSELDSPERKRESVYAICSKP